MKKIISSILAVMLLLSIASVSFTTNAASYNASAAVNYALSHWNDGVGLCAEFVSKALRAGGISIPNNASYYGYNTQSYNNNSGILEYWTNPYTCSAPQLKYLATKYRVITNPSNSQISVGDVVFMKNSSGSRDGHVGICISNNGRAVYAAHNRATKTGTFSSSYPCTYVVKMGGTIPVPTYFNVNFRCISGAYTDAYSNYDLSTKVGRIYTGDLIRIRRVFSNGVAMLDCPWGSSGALKTVYARITELKFKANHYFNAYNLNGSKCGRVYPGDVCSFISIQSNEICRVYCPWSGGYQKEILIRGTDIYG